MDQMGYRLQIANEDYAAEQDYHARQEAALQFRLKVVTIGVCVGVPVLIVSTAYLTYRMTR
ncbi:hypothetical protein FACS1894151_11110 [Spirochaetia bacterium]|nr:hypothetical protein FACS1894151_11110 [Spirochaetia bacterium]